jgi:bacterioferritin (cytochrome b1)
MIRKLLAKKADRDTERGVQNSLHKAFKAVDEEEDAVTKRLLEQMDKFTENPGPHP